MVPPWCHHFFKISYIARNGDAFTVNIPRGWWQDNYDEKNTIEGRKKKIQSLTKKEIKKFK